MDKDTGITTGEWLQHISSIDVGTTEQHLYYSPINYYQKLTCNIVEEVFVANCYDKNEANIIEEKLSANFVEETMTATRYEY
jgi:hypothetical protein